jgi:hypothetical protein
MRRAMIAHATQPASERKAQADDDRRKAVTIAAPFEAKFRRSPDVLTAVPGRVEFIGNHTDHNGGLVGRAAIDRDICVAIAGGRRLRPRGHGT